MEWIWYIIAALGAGIGTGLAGLSAATVMVPVLIVLCPSFAGETGAYQATAIALASDILGSAVTTYTYTRHKNIDLKRGWIMLMCILGMCTVGSYAAFLVGNVVLGSFTLFLTFFIGIRFLIKPDTSRKDTAGKGEKLDWQAAALTSVIMAAAIYPLLALLEHEKWYGRFFVQKSPGENKRSLLMLFFMFAAVTAFAWGVIGKPHIAAASILMWGMGDASAALVGSHMESIRSEHAMRSNRGRVRWSCSRQPSLSGRLFCVFSEVYQSNARLLRLFRQQPRVLPQSYSPQASGIR